MNVQRKLAAILSADVAGYSRLMGEDEAGTLATLKAHRAEFIDPAIASHGGRIVKLMGDGTLVEFPSVVDAVECAVAVQQGMAARNADAPTDTRIDFRIGVNLGDIIIDGDDIYGDGVNVAARLQEIAETGGVAISAAAHDQIVGKVDIGFDDAGEHELKNIAKPVRVWRWADGAAAPAAETPLALPDKPSIAVLPFTNMSGDAEQEYFSDGITEDIITELARFKNLFVIARNSSFAFKGQAVNVGEVGEKLGVAYIVEGSVRKAGNRVRVTAQLVVAASGNHLWVERYDRDLEDIFAVQDELVREIAAAVPGQLDASAMQSARRRPIENLTAYDFVLRGEWLRYRDYGSRDGRAMFERAVDADPGCARAYGNLANWHAYSIFAHGVSVEDAAAPTRSFAERAVETDSSDPAVQANVAHAYLMVGEHDLAKRHIDRAIKLNPNDYVVMLYAGLVLAYLGDTDEGLEWMRKLMRHDPISIESFREGMFEIYYLARRYDDAVESVKGWSDPSGFMLALIAAAYSMLDRMDEALAARRQFERDWPDDRSIGALARAFARQGARQEDHDHWLDGFRKAGFEV